jgi:hypothetical protein
MEIICYYQDAEIMIHSNNGIIDNVYIWKDDEHLFKSLFYNSLNSLFVHVCEPIEFIKSIKPNLVIYNDECELDESNILYNIECDKLRQTISNL